MAEKKTGEMPKMALPEETGMAEPGNSRKRKSKKKSKGKRAEGNVEKSESTSEIPTLTTVANPQGTATANPSKTVAANPPKTAIANPPKASVANPPKASVTNLPKAAAGNTPKTAAEDPKETAAANPKETAVANPKDVAQANPGKKRKNKSGKKSAQKTEASEAQPGAAEARPREVCIPQDKKSSDLELRPIRRPAGSKGVGSSGRPIKLIANYFEIKIPNPNIQITQYDVVIKNFKGSDKIPKNVKREVMKHLQLQFKQVFKDCILAFDGEKNAYSLNPNKNVVDNFEVDISVTGVESKPSDKFSVKMKVVADVTLISLLESVKTSVRTSNINNQVLQMLEIIFKEFRARRFVSIGRNSFFNFESSNRFLYQNMDGSGKVAVKGFFSSIRPAGWKDGSILLNFDISNAVFFKPQTILEFMAEKLDIRDQKLLNVTLDQRTRKKLEKELKGLKVRTMHNNRTTKVVGISPLAANRQMFPKDPNRPQELTSVADYFRTQYNLPLKKPNLNCFHVGNPQRKVFIPMEICRIDKAQKVTKKLDPKETNDFVRTTAVEPRLRLQHMRSLFEDNQFHNDPLLRQLGFTVGNQPLHIEGRVLGPPTITAPGRKTLNKGSWFCDKFPKGGVMRKWVVILYDRRCNYKAFIDKLVRTAVEKGMDCQHPIKVVDGLFGQVRKQFTDLRREIPDLELVMCILCDPAPPDLYGNIKRVADLDVSVPSQCVKPKTVSKLDRSTIENLLFKINGKLDGVNNGVISNPEIRVFEEPILIMGADVNHPPAGGSDDIPSVAAVVGSRHMNGTSKYGVEIRAQEHRLEYINDMKGITKNLLKGFYNSTGMKPHRIIMYRDGVSESQFTQVLSFEMTRIRAACTELNANYKPPITFICVQKRHHTRLFCENPQDGIPKMNNVPPGTVVDKDIAHPHDMDFFLVSHLGIQGTSRPTHYTVLWDDSSFSMEILQLLTFQLCHAYYRCNKSVSIPCPVYYAHLAAFRGKTYLGSDEDGSSSEGRGGPIDVSMANVSMERHYLSNRLFYI